MQEAEFDRFADEYDANLRDSIASSGESPEFFSAYKVEDVAKVARRKAVVPTKILDFGSGIGASIPQFRLSFPDTDLVCADVSSKSLKIARTRFPGNETYAKIENDRLSLGDDSADIAFSYDASPSGEVVNGCPLGCTILRVR